MPRLGGIKSEIPLQMPKAFLSKGTLRVGTSGDQNDKIRTLFKGRLV